MVPMIMGDPAEEFMKAEFHPPTGTKEASQDAKENLIYILQRVFEVFGYSKIVAVSTDKKIILSMAEVLARQEFYKPRMRGREQGKWDYIVLVYDNESGKFLDKVEIPRFKE